MRISMRKNIALLLVLVFLTASCFMAAKPALSTAEVVENSWATKTPMHEARFGLGVAVVDSKIYAIGGLASSGSFCTNINEEYNPKTDTWSYKTAMPTERAHFGIAVYQNKIYCIGGLTSPNADPTGINEVYDPVTDTWETKTSMPTQQGYLDANLVKGKIYLIGGSPSVNEVYDHSSDTWTTKTAPPVAVRGYVSAVVDDEIYVIGGWDSEGAGSDLNQIYTPQTDTWRSGSPIPIGYPGGAGATTGVSAPKRIYALGGGGLVPDNRNQVYDPENDSWSTGVTVPTARGSLGVAVVDDLLYVIGGGNGWSSFFSGANEQYTPFGYGTVPPYTEETEAEPFPIALVAAASVATVAVLGVGLLVYFKKRKR
jgi:N-acetylneuraminic acid mutarotase